MKWIIQTDSMRILCCVLILCFTACGPSKNDIPKLIRQLSSHESSERNSAALSLASLGADAAPATSALIRCLKDENGGVRSSAAYALRAIDTPEARKALDSYNK